MNSFGLANNTDAATQDVVPATNATSLSGFVTVQDAVRAAKDAEPTILMFVDEFAELMTDKRASVKEIIS